MKEAPPKMLPAVNSLSPIFDGTFIKMLSFAIVCTVACNAFIDAQKQSGNTDYELFSLKVVVEDFFTVLIIDLIVFPAWNFHTHIRKGTVPPVTSQRLREVARFPFTYIAEANWRRRILLFLAQSLVVPGAPLVAGKCIMTMNCFGGATTTSLAKFLFITEFWKVFAVVTLFILNYIAAHNADQPELQLHKADAAATMEKKQQ